jgi:hypothetical protein
MIFQATMLAFRLVSMHIMAEDQAVSVALHARDAVLAEGALFPGDSGPLKTTLLLVAWTARESAGRPWLDGDRDVFGVAHSLGRMQFRDSWLSVEPLKLFGLNRKQVLADDGRTQMAMGLHLMLWLRDHQCGGSVMGALNAYASGSCKGTPASLRKVADRCGLIGGC